VPRRDPDDQGRKKSVRDTEQEQEQEQEQEKELHQDQQQSRDAAQDAVGNQAVQDMMGVVTAKAGEAGQGADLAARKATEEIGIDYGGDDVPADAPITMEDLVRSWNPTTTRGQDKEAFRDALGTEELPEVDPALSEALGPLPPLRVRDAVFLSAAATALDPGPTLRTAVRLAGASALARVVRWFAGPPRVPLVDPRVVVVRARALAFATLLAESTCEAVPAADRALLRPMHRFLLELAAQRQVLQELLDKVAAEKTLLPLAADLVQLGLPGTPEPAGSGQSPSVEQIEHVKATLLEWLPRVPAATLVPELPPAATPGPAVEDDDDPLGLDALFGRTETTDPAGPQYDSLLAAAEKLAVASARTRVEAAAAVLATTSVLGTATASSLARRAARELDAEAGKVLQLLVEVARAIQQRAVAPPGVRNGLRRGAKGVDLCWTQFCGWLTGVVAHAIPPPPALALPPLPKDTELDQALTEGSRAAARAAIPVSAAPEVQVARLLLADLGPTTAEDAHRVAAGARAAGRPALARLVDLWVVVAAAEDRGRALGMALRVQQEAFVAGDDLAFAVVTHVLLDLTVRTRPDRVAAQHLEACRRLHSLGPTAGLALLTRWSPREENAAEDRDTLAP
jgi:hypothetical protein